MNQTKPKEPIPEDFGISKERVQALQRGYFGKLIDKYNDKLLRLVLSAYGKYAFIFLFLSYIVYAFQKSKSVWEVLFGLLSTIFVIIFAGFFCLFFIAIGTAIICLIADALWHRFQSDYQKFRSFQKTNEHYQQQLAEWLKTSVFWWQSLDGRRFELELAQLFTKRGYEVEWLGKAGDGGVDLILKKSNTAIIAQCKAHKRPIGPAAVRDLYGTLLHRNGKEAWLISVSGFSNAALSFAQQKPIRLLDIAEIITNDND